MKRFYFGIICLLSLLFMTGCQIIPKALTNEEFIKIVQENGLNPIDVKEQFSEYDIIESATIGLSENGWQMEYYVLSDKNEAKNMFNKNKTSFEQKYKSGRKVNNIEIGNYNKYTLETKETYVTLVRINNTFLYTNVTPDKKEEVIKVIKALKY